jgi:hypothetical protein
METFYQLVVATNGQLCAEEAWLLFDICSQKIAGTYDFYHRIGNLMRDVGRLLLICNISVLVGPRDIRLHCQRIVDFDCGRFEK